MQGRDAESFTQVIFHHFESGKSKPYCTQIIRFYINYAKRIFQDDNTVRVQVLNEKDQRGDKGPEYLDFLSVWVEKDLSVEDKLKNII